MIVANVAQLSGSVPNSFSVLLKTTENRNVLTVVASTFDNVLIAGSTTTPGAFYCLTRRSLTDFIALHRMFQGSLRMISAIEIAWP